MSKQIIEQARKCPQDYEVAGRRNPKWGKSLQAWDNDPDILKLSEMLRTAGYEHAARSVIGGCKWVQQIADGYSIDEIEAEASDRRWSWNREKME